MKNTFILNVIGAAESQDEIIGCADYEKSSGRKSKIKTDSPY